MEGVVLFYSAKSTLKYKKPTLYIYNQLGIDIIEKQLPLPSPRLLHDNTYCIAYEDWSLRYRQKPERNTIQCVSRSHKWMNSTADKFDIINQQRKATEKHGIQARMNQIIIFKKSKRKKRVNI